MDLRSGKSTTTSGAGKSSRDAAETVCEALTQPARATISPHSSSDQFRVWKIRFIAHINSDKPALAPGIEQDNPTLSASDNAKLAAILVGWLDSDFILELLNVVDVEKDGISMFSHICSHFQNTTSSEPSPEERVYKAIRHIHRANHDSLALFLRAINQVSAEYASLAAPASTNPPSTSCWPFMSSTSSTRLPGSTPSRLQPPRSFARSPMKPSASRRSTRTSWTYVQPPTTVLRATPPLHLTLMKPLPSTRASASVTAATATATATGACALHRWHQSLPTNSTGLTWPVFHNKGLTTIHTLA